MTAYTKRISHEATSYNTFHAMGFTEVSSAHRRQRAQSTVFAQLGRFWALLIAVVAILAPAPAARAADSFGTIPALNFSTTYTIDNPISQVITVTSTGSPISFKAAASVNTGGNWLTITPSNYGFGVSTPFGITVTAAPAITLVAGTYTGQIVLSASGVESETVNVTLVVHNPTDTYFDQIAGALSFSMLTSGIAPPTQPLQVRSANSNSLAWTASTSTADGGSWLTVSSTGGTAPSNLSVGVTTANLPGGGGTAGTFTGQIVFTSSGDTVTVPIAVTVGDDVLAQVNPLNFAMSLHGSNPLAQEITIASTTSTAISIKAVVANSTGGNWLTITPSNYGFGVSTPYNIEVSVNPAVTVVAGTYSAEIIVSIAGTGSAQLTIPVTLTINPPSTAFFDNVSGSVNFSMATGGEGPPPQDIQIRDGIAGSIPWTATVTTADGNNWLSVSTSTGTSPSIVSVSVNPANVPGAGLTAETMVGQILLTGSNSRVTIPISFTLAAAAFRQVAPINFVMPASGVNPSAPALPLAQVLTIGSTGASISFKAVAVNGTGGSWLVINPTNYGFGIATPRPIDVSVNPAVTLTAGVYTAEILVTSVDGTQNMTIPVTLTLEPPTATYFDSLPGQMSFSMVTGGTAPPAQVLPIRNAGQGTLDWNATVTTSDGGNWLSISAESGTATSEAMVSVNPANIPNGGLVGGTFTGLISLQENGLEISIPVSFVVGANVYRQINPLTFTMIQGGANPLSQVITAASTGTTFNFLASTYASNGGSWLTITPSNYGFGVATPYNITVGVNAPVTMTAGTYSSEVVLISADGTQGLTVPVTLNVLPKTATMFDSLPGQLTFSMATQGTAPPSEPLEIRNAGAGTLTWTAKASTSDGGNWLSISAGTGTAPAVPQVTVNPANIPNAGLVAGIFTGQVVLETPGDRVTIPVTFTVGANVLRQVNGLDFNMTFKGNNPLPQIISIPSTGTNLQILATAVNSTGGNWLQITPSNYGFGVSTPMQIIASATPAVTQVAGTYTSEIIVRDSGYDQTIVIPVTLHINPAASTYFSDVQGGATFSVATGSTANPPSQAIPIRNAGIGTLKWTATASTSDGAKWLTLSAASGTAPDTLTIGVNTSLLPNSALLAGYFNGQVVLTSGTDRQTIPVAVVVGTNLFAPTAALAFSKPYAGANPGFKAMNVTSTGSSFNFVGRAASATGGNWLSITSPANGNFGFGVATPFGVQLTASPALTLPPGIYTGETIYTSTDNSQGQVVPVTLNVYSVPAATPKISLKTGTYIGNQTVTITDATPGAKIYYSLNGKSPTNASTPYTKPIQIAINEKLEAVAYQTYYLPSAIASSTYVIEVATPTFSVKSGTYPAAFTVTLKDATPGSTIYYTTNGATPTAASKKYTAAISVTLNQTIKALAMAPGKHTSALATATYDIETAKPVMKPAGGSVVSGSTVTITDATKGAVIYYTTNKTAPTIHSTKYTKPIVVKAAETIEAIAIAPSHTPSLVTVESFRLK